MSDSLSKKQQQILDFIRQAKADNGYPPSYREICDGVGLKSTSTIHGHLDRLEKKGYIRKDPLKTRCIEIVDENPTGIQHEMVQIPIVGKVAAGEPLLATENIEDYLPLPLDYISDTKGTLFIVTVQGDSMINRGIYQGDYLIVKQQSTAHDKEVVVALIDDSVTVKTFYKEADRIRLQPENDFMDPIYVQDVSILGRVIGVYRIME